MDKILPQSLRTELHQVADGRRLASRSIVLQSLNSIPCYIFRKVITPIKDSPFSNRTDETWGGLGVADVYDEHAFDYEPLGHAMIALEQYTGGHLHDDEHSLVPEEATFTGQIEPYFIDKTGRERLLNIPEWTVKGGDLVCLILGVDNFIYFECVGRMGQSLMGDFGVKYLLNPKHELDFVDLQIP